MTKIKIKRLEHRAVGAQEKGLISARQIDVKRLRNSQTHGLKLFSIEYFNQKWIKMEQDSISKPFLTTVAYHGGCSRRARA